MSDTAPPALRLATIADANAAVGTAVRLMIGERAFAELSFGDWAGVIEGQVTRGHYRFVIDGDNQVQGYFGWALATRARAEFWADGSRLTDDDCREGDCVIINAWIEKSSAARRDLKAALRQVLHGKTMMYARRRYPDGTVRTARTPIDPSVSAISTAASDRTPVPS